MVIEKVSPAEMLGHPLIQEMLKSLKSDNITIEQVGKYISMIDVYRIGDVGYFTVEECSDQNRKECHAYFFPDKRKYSIRALKVIYAFITEQGYGIYTTVSGDFPHVVKVLRMLGFKIQDVWEDALTKGGIPYSVFHLTNNLPTRV